ncbi:agmatine deiminase family protein [Candidatus Micrarchaeota archaeon]|nr:agmatine deiminase family protein [Candidatus Micrarchaeota archaeon]
MERQSPSSLGFSMPAEWEEHESTWVIFPHNENTWPDGRLEGVQKVYAQMLARVSVGEKVNLLVESNSVKELAGKLIFENDFANRQNIFFHSIPTMDSWIRDCGPTFLLSKDKKELAMVEWVFNAWGEKYESEEPLSNDKIIPSKINELLDVRVFKPGIVMEGGSIDVNGAGTVLTTQQCLLNKNRNSNLSKAQIGGYLKDYLGVDNVVWLKDGIEGDDTDGHVDDIARFVSKNKVLVCSPEKTDSANYPLMAENKKILSDSGFDVIDLPMPGNVFDERRLPASYANFYVTNSCVISPIFGEKNDSAALDLLKECFKGREIIGLPSKQVVYGFGSWHCLTQQQPATK